MHTFRPDGAAQGALHKLARRDTDGPVEMLTFDGFVSGLAPKQHFVINGSAEQLASMFGIPHLTDGLFVQYRDLGENGGAYSYAENAIYLSDKLPGNPDALETIFVHELAHRSIRLASFSLRDQPPGDSTVLTKMLHESIAELLGIFIKGTFNSAPSEIRRPLEYAACRLISHASDADTMAFEGYIGHVRELETRATAPDGDVLAHLLDKYRESRAIMEGRDPLPEELHENVFPAAYAALGVAALSYINSLPERGLDAGEFVRELADKDGLQLLQALIERADFDEVYGTMQEFYRKEICREEF